MYRVSPDVSTRLMLDPLQKHLTVVWERVFSKVRKRTSILHCDGRTPDLRYPAAPENVRSTIALPEPLPTVLLAATMAELFHAEHVLTAIGARMGRSTVVNLRLKALHRLRA